MQVKQLNFIVKNHYLLKMATILKNGNGIKNKLGFFLIFLCSISVAVAQSVTNKGKEFWVGYGHHQYMEPTTCGGGAGPNDMNMKIYLSNTESQTATVTLTIDSSGLLPNQWFKKIYNIPPFTVIETENMPKGSVNAAASGSNVNYDARLFSDPPPASFGGEQVFRKKGIHIESTLPIVAYAHIYGGVSSGATMLLPIEAWGYSYTSINSYQGGGVTGCFSWMYVIAKDDNTVVEITPSQQSRLGKPAGIPFQVTLQRGQIYQLIGDAVCATGSGVQLTGTKIRSISNSVGDCKPIAVFSGSSRTGGEEILCGTGSGRDNDMQQCYPQQAWGKRYLTAPFSRSSGGTLQPSNLQTNVFKIAIKDPTTIVKRNNVVLTGLINGSYYAYTSSTPDYIEANKPVMVAQFMSNGSACAIGDGDPEMVFLSPIEQGIKKAGFYRTNLQAILSNYITIIVPTAGVSSLKIDNSSVFSYTFPHTNKPGYTVVVKGWPAAKSQSIVQCDSSFNAITYGLGGAESYAYNAGTNLDNLSALPGYHNTPDTSASVVIHPYTFVNTPMQIGAYIAYKPLQMTWKLSSIGCSIVTPCADVTDISPVALDSLVVGAAKYYLYRLPGTYSFNTAGTYYLPIDLQSPNSDNGNCNNKETVQIAIIVKPKPTADFTYYQNAGCGVDTVRFQGISPTAENYQVIKWKWRFTAAPADTSNIQNPSFFFPTAGTYPVKLTITTLFGGIADTTINVVVTSGSRPNSKFGANPSTVCLGQPITFSDSTAYAGTTGWYWDFGNGTTLTAPTNANQVITYTTPGTYIVKHTINITAATCLADTVSKTVFVITTPHIDSAKGFNPAGCFSSVGFIELYGLTPSTSYTVNYTKNGTPVTATFVSNAAGVLTIPNLTVGTYASISVMLSTGCSSNVVGPVVLIDNSGPTTPIASSNSPICAGGVLNLTASGSNGTYYWTGPNGFTSTLRNPTISNITTAGSGTYNVSSVFGICYGTPAAINVVVNDIPVISSGSFTNPTTCATLTGTIILNGLSANTSYTVSYTLNAVAVTLTLSSNATGVIVIPNLGAGTYSFIYVSANNCASNFVGPYTLSDPNPPATPTATNNSPICVGSTLSFTANSATAGVAYTWTGPNGFTSTQQNPTIPSATSAASGLYSVTASLAGCTSTAGTTNATVYDIPTAPTAGSNSPVCAGVPLNLTSSSTSPGVTYAWTGPNGFISGLQNPTVASPTLLDAGVYSVIAGANGCTSAAGTTTVVINAVPAISSSSKTDPTTCATATGFITLNGLVANATYTVNYTKNGTAQTATLTSNGTGVLVIPNLSSGTYAAITATLTGCTSTPVGPFTLNDPNPPATPTVSSNTPICEGSTLNLTASSSTVGVTYAWTGPNTFISAIQNPSITSATVAASGTYNVTATLAGCVSTPGTTVVVVNPIPATPTASSNTPICAGTALNLTSNTTSTGTVSYAWTGPNTFTSALQNPTITTPTVAASGTYSVTATINNCTSAAGTTVVVVNAIPAISSTVLGNPIACATATGSISLNGLVAGASYTVNYTKNSTTQTTTITANGSGSVVITNLSAGSYTNITVSLNGCTSAAVGPFTLTDPNPPAVPTAGSNAPICEGVTLNLTASSATAGVTYAWSGPNTFTSALQNPSIASSTVLASGTYNVTATLNNCTSAPGSTTVLIKPVPAVPTAASNSPICAGSDLNLTATSTTAGATYTWTGPNTFSSSTQNPTITAASIAANGTYSVTATVAGCTSAAGTTIAVVNGIPVISSSSFISPNTCATATGSITLNGLIAGATYTVSYTKNSVAQSATITASASGVVVIPTLTAGSYTSVFVSLNNCTSNIVGPFNLADPNPPATPVAGSNSAICEGVTLNLTANSATAGVTYAWTGPNGFNNATQNPSIVSSTLLASGTYSVIATLNNCTSAPGTTSVVIKPIPVVPTAGSNTPICSGTTLSLTATTTTSSVTSYAWTGPNTFASTIQNPSIAAATVAASGTYNVTATLNGCTSAAGTTIVVVNGTPVITSSSFTNPTTCATTTGTISLNGLVANATYTVSYTKNTVIQTSSITASASGVVVIPALLAGTYSNVFVTLNNCTSNVVGPFSLSDPNPPATPVAGSNTPVCSTNTLNLTANSATVGVSYTWSGPNGFTSTTQNPSITSVTVLASGSYSVTATLNSCVSAAGTTVVLVKPTPIITSSVGNNPTNCATSTGSIVLNGLTAGSAYAVNYTQNATPQTATLTANASGVVTIPNLPAGTYSNVTVTINGCTSLAAGPFALADPNPPTTPTVGSNTPVCSGNALNLTASTTTSGAITYTWSGPNSFTNTTQNPTIAVATVAASGTYTVTATLNNCTSAAGSTTVVVNLTPTITSSSSTNPTDCNSATGTIILNGLTANTSFTVNYSFNGAAQTATLSSDASGVITIPALVAGAYTNVSVTANACPSNVVGPFALADPAPPATPSVSSNSSICAGSTLSLSSNTTTLGVTYAWSGPNGFNSTIQNPSIPNATTAATGIYSLVITKNSCTSTASTTAIVGAIPVTAFSMPTSLCMPNGTATFTNTSTVSDGSTLTYTWTYGDGSTGTADTHTYLTTPVSGSVIVKLTATSSVGCVKDSSQTFSGFYDKPIANFNVAPDTLCQGTNNVFTDLSTAPNSTITSWSWIFGDGRTSTLKNPNQKYTLPGNYTVKLTVANAVGCTSDIFSKPVIVYLQPIVDAGPSFVIPQGTIITFNPKVNDSTSLAFKWTPAADFTNNTVLRPSIIALKNQTYTLMAIGQGNCSASDTLTVKVLKTVTIPNAFSPNGDGINDTWNLENLKDYPGASVEVYNRYGQVIYYSIGYSKPWDGTSKDKPLPVGTYYYIITLKNGFEAKAGWVLLIR